MATICPYCRGKIDEEEISECPDCGIPHHLECWHENNGCSIPGCSQSPEDEPKMHVSAAGSARSAIVQAVPGRHVSALNKQGDGIDGQCARKNRITFMLLGLFLGAFGIHNFYAGYTARGIVQLLIACLTLFYGIFISWPWAILEILLVSRDALRRPMD